MAHTAHMTIGLFVKLFIRHQRVHMTIEIFDGGFRDTINPTITFNLILVS